MATLDNTAFGYTWQADTNRFDLPQTDTLYRFLDSEVNDKRRVTGLSIEEDGVFIYTDSSQWCDDAGAGTFRGDSETAAIKLFKQTVRPRSELDTEDYTPVVIGPGIKINRSLRKHRNTLVHRIASTQTMRGTLGVYHAHKVAIHYHRALNQR